MGLLGFVGQKLMVVSARQHLNSGSVANPFFLKSPKTQDAVKILQAYSKNAGDLHLAWNYDLKPGTQGRWGR